MSKMRYDNDTINMLEKGLLAEAAFFIREELSDVLEDSSIGVSECHKEFIQDSSKYCISICLEEEKKSLFGKRKDHPIVDLKIPLSRYSRNKDDAWRACIYSDLSALSLVYSSPDDSIEDKLKDIVEAAMEDFSNKRDKLLFPDAESKRTKYLILKTSEEVCYDLD